MHPAPRQILARTARAVGWSRLAADPREFARLLERTEPRTEEGEDLPRRRGRVEDLVLQAVELAHALYAGARRDAALLVVAKNAERWMRLVLGHASWRDLLPDGQEAASEASGLWGALELVEQKSLGALGAKKVRPRG